MAQIDIHINGRSYTVGCNEGEQERVRASAKRLDEKVTMIAQSLGQIGEARLLLMAGLMLADELDHRALDDSVPAAELADHRQWLDEILRKIEGLSARLGNP